MFFLCFVEFEEDKKVLTLLCFFESLKKIGKKLLKVKQNHCQVRRTSFRGVTWRLWEEDAKGQT